MSKNRIEKAWSRVVQRGYGFAGYQLVDVEDCGVELHLRAQCAGSAKMFVLRPDKATIRSLSDESLVFYLREHLERLRGQSNEFRLVQQLKDAKECEAKALQAAHEANDQLRRLDANLQKQRRNSEILTRNRAARIVASHQREDGRISVLDTIEAEILKL